MDQIEGLLKNDTENNSYDVGQFVLSFVQSIQYGTDQNTSGQVNYPRFPDETLVDKVGDCKDHSTLYYSLMGSPEINIGVVLFELTPPTGTVGHMAVGIWETGGTGLYVQNDGRDYYYCETTATGWLIGEEPPQFDNYRSRYCPPEMIDVKAGNEQCTNLVWFPVTLRYHLPI